MEKTTYYDILGVASTASSQQIRDAYRTLAKRYHPDCNGNNPVAERLMKRLNAIYAILKDEQKRAQYDRSQTLCQTCPAPAGAACRSFASEGPAAPFNRQANDLSDPPPRDNIDAFLRFYRVRRGERVYEAPRAAPRRVIPETVTEQDLLRLCRSQADLTHADRLRKYDFLRRVLLARPGTASILRAAVLDALDIDPQDSETKAFFGQFIKAGGAETWDAEHLQGVAARIVVNARGVGDPVREHGYDYLRRMIEARPDLGGAVILPVFQAACRREDRNFGSVRTCVDFIVRMIPEEIAPRHINVIVARHVGHSPYMIDRGAAYALMHRVFMARPDLAPIGLSQIRRVLRDDKDRRCPEAIALMELTVALEGVWRRRSDPPSWNVAANAEPLKTALRIN